MFLDEETTYPFSTVDKVFGLDVGEVMDIRQEFSYCLDDDNLINKGPYIRQDIWVPIAYASLQKHPDLWTYVGYHDRYGELYYMLIPDDERGQYENLGVHSFSHAALLCIGEVGSSASAYHSRKNGYVNGVAPSEGALQMTIDWTNQLNRGNIGYDPKYDG